MKSGSTATIPAKYKLKYHKISRCHGGRPRNGMQRQRGPHLACKMLITGARKNRGICAGKGEISRHDAVLAGVNGMQRGLLALRVPVMAAPVLWSAWHSCADAPAAPPAASTGAKIGRWLPCTGLAYSACACIVCRVAGLRKWLRRRGFGCLP